MNIKDKWRQIVLIILSIMMLSKILLTQSVTDLDIKLIEEILGLSSKG